MGFKARKPKKHEYVLFKQEDWAAIKEALIETGHEVTLTDMTLWPVSFGEALPEGDSASLWEWTLRRTPKFPSDG